MSVRCQDCIVFKDMATQSYVIFIILRKPTSVFQQILFQFYAVYFFYNLILFANSYMTIYAQFFLPITFHVSKKPTNQKPYLQNRFYYIFNS